MRRGLGWSERLKAPRMVSHQGARFQMGTERIQDGSPSFRIKLRISIIQLVPVRRNSADQSKGGTGAGEWGGETESCWALQRHSLRRLTAQSLTAGGEARK